MKDEVKNEEILRALGVGMRRECVNEVKEEGTRKREQCGGTERNATEEGVEEGLNEWEGMRRRGVNEVKHEDVVRE
jgi:hypothetical protein